MPNLHYYLFIGKIPKLIYYLCLFIAISKVVEVV